MTDRTDPERSPATWLKRPRPGAQRACARCGETFVPPWPSTKYCSPACREVVEAARRARRKAPEGGAP